ncbi:hypothetical protein ACEPPN_010298 [Leptodophora sp. 'Broadleaf-Isolate-01']
MSSTNDENLKPNMVQEAKGEVSSPTITFVGDSTNSLPSKSPPAENSAEANDDFAPPSPEPVRSASSIDAPLEVFTLFPKLPAELRCKVWFHALPDPRVVEIDWIWDTEWACRHESQDLPSGLLRANKESRVEFLKSYFPFLEVTIPGTDDDEDEDEYIFRSYHDLLVHGSVTYMNPRIDTLYISANYGDRLNITTRSMSALLAMASLKKLEILACEYSEVKDRSESLSEIVNDFFPSLRSIIVSVGDLKWSHFFEDGMERPSGKVVLENPLAPVRYSSRQLG